MSPRSHCCRPVLVLLATATLAGCVDEATAPNADDLSSPRATVPAVASGAQQAAPQVQASGAGWRVLRVTGVGRDADGVAKMVDEDILVADSLAALDVSPLPARARGEVKASFAKLPASERNGPIIVSLAVARQMEGQVTPQFEWPECEAVTSTWSSTLRSSMPFARSIPAPLGGAATFAGVATPNVGASVTFHVVRGGIWPACVPVATSVRSFRLSGGIDVTGAADINGAFAGSFRSSVTVISPQFFSELFLIGPLPVWLTAELPIDVGIEVGGKVKFNGKATATAHGDFTTSCAPGTCSTTKNVATKASWSNNRMPTFDARAVVAPYVQGGVKLLVYWGLVSGQIGLRATMRNDVWAYAGESCGDANNDGKPESVQAATLDARLGLSLRASVAFVGVRAGSWSWPVGDDRFIGFWDLIGSSALSPIFYVSSHEKSTYTVRLAMRPCWPYANTMSYAVNWGDGASVELSAAPKSLVAKSHTYAAGEARYSVKLTARKDAAGRVLNRSVWVPIRVGPG